MHTILYALLITSYHFIYAVCPSATGGSSTIHTIAALFTALALTGVAVLFYWASELAEHD